MSEGRQRRPPPWKQEPRDRFSMTPGERAKECAIGFVIGFVVGIAIWAYYYRQASAAALTRFDRWEVAISFIVVTVGVGVFFGSFPLLDLLIRSRFRK